MPLRTSTEGEGEAIGLSVDIYTADSPLFFLEDMLGLAANTRISQWSF